MASNIFKRYLWLIEIIRTHGPIDFDGINEFWHRSCLNEDGEDLPKKTFHNHCEQIAEIFDVEIVCDRKNGYRYSLDAETLANERRMDWLNALIIQNSIYSCKGMENKIYCSSVRWHPLIGFLLDVINNKQSITFMHYGSMLKCRYERENKNPQPDPDDTGNVIRKFTPFFLMYLDERWFAIGKMSKSRHDAVFCLDCMLDVEIIDFVFTDFPEITSVRDYLNLEFFIDDYKVFDDKTLFKSARQMENF